MRFKRGQWAGWRPSGLWTRRMRPTFMETARPQGRNGKEIA